ncbi:MAG: nitrous oxide reductase family maturation protein NosD, partial [Thermodesulfobacteriota bacterium]
MNGNIMVNPTVQRIVGLLFFSIVMASTASALAAEQLVPDRYKSIQEAIDNAAPGDTVVISGGEEYRENLVIDKPLTVRRDTTSETVVIAAASIEEPVITVRGATAVKVIGITLSGSTKAGLYVVDSSEVQIEGVSATGNRYGIHLVRSNGNIIQESSAQFNEYGIYLVESRDNIIKGNRADNNRDKGIVLLDASRNSITDNSA